jgi:3D (Asp-Asp-Asp) domain-containing protein
MTTGRPNLPALRCTPLCLAAAVAASLQAGAAAADPADLKATYAITLAIFTIGKVEISARFTDTGYAAEIKGLTTGLGRLVSDSHAELTGAGTISGSRVLPTSYTLRTAEGDFTTRIDMTERGGSLATVRADPQLIEAADRVPITQETLARIVDPVGALIVARDTAGPVDGKVVCNRTIPVFDGWVRYDIALSYKETANFVGRGFTSQAIVCQARYVPVAGHRLSRDSVQFMAQNERLEAWLVPVKGTNLMVPVKFIIGTNVGDLALTARDFVVAPVQRQAATVAPPAATPATK